MTGTGREPRQAVVTVSGSMAGEAAGGSASLRPLQLRSPTAEPCTSHAQMFAPQHKPASCPPGLPRLRPPLLPRRTRAVLSHPAVEMSSARRSRAAACRPTLLRAQRVLSVMSGATTWVTDSAASRTHLAPSCMCGAGRESRGVQMGRGGGASWRPALRGTPLLHCGEDILQPTAAGRRRRGGCAAAQRRRRAAWPGPGANLGGQLPQRVRGGLWAVPRQHAAEEHHHPRQDALTGGPQQRAHVGGAMVGCSGQREGPAGAGCTSAVGIGSSSSPATHAHLAAPRFDGNSWDRASCPSPGRRAALIWPAPTAAAHPARRTAAAFAT